MPFANESPDPADAYLGAELSEELAEALTRIPGMRVVPRSTALAMSQAPDRRAMSQRLGVQALLEGRVRKLGVKLHLSAELIKVADGLALWSQSYDRETKDVWGIQVDLAQQVAEALGLKVTESSRLRLLKKSNQNLEAYYLYLLGRSYLSSHTEEGYTKAIAAYRQALAKDPANPLIYVGLSQTYHLLVDNGYLSPSLGKSNVLYFAEKALAIDPDLSEAHVAVGNAKYMNWEWSGAEQEYQRALALDSLNASAYYGYASMLSSQGRMPEALTTKQQVFDADPFSGTACASLASTLEEMGRLDEALDKYRLAAQLDPQYKMIHYGRAWNYIQNGRLADAVTELEASLREMPQSTMVIGTLAYAYGLTGHRNQALQQLDQLRAIARQHPVSPFDFALVYMGLGDTNRALAELEKAYDEHDDQLIYLLDREIYSRLQSEPRFQVLLKKIGLEK